MLPLLYYTLVPQDIHILSECENNGKETRVIYEELNKHLDSIYLFF